ncbi:MAG: hypothetical protein IKM54_05885 [Butyricicoccus sp.]|nr:hypothetical protein [Butyricicoccus sp.]
MNSAKTGIIETGGFRRTMVQEILAYHFPGNPGEASSCAPLEEEAFCSLKRKNGSLSDSDEKRFCRVASGTIFAFYIK